MKKVEDENDGNNKGSGEVGASVLLLIERWEEK
jgi:hypothetical protein